jgi:hypothetical protein
VDSISISLVLLLLLTSSSLALRSFVKTLLELGLDIHNCGINGLAGILGTTIRDDFVSNPSRLKDLLDRVVLTAKKGNRTREMDHVRVLSQAGLGLLSTFHRCGMR